MKTELFTDKELNEVLTQFEQSSNSLYGISEFFGYEKLEDSTKERLQDLLDTLDSTKESITRILQG